MKVLVACEYSGRVRDAFRKKGHDAWSCDLEPDMSDSKFHFQGDVTPLLKESWDLVIAHPPCTFLCNSGVHLLFEKERGPDGLKPFNQDRMNKMEDAAIFFRQFLELDHVPRVAVENPVMHGYGKMRIGDVQQSQIIQPWQHGHTEKKATCLWLKGLPKLIPTDIVQSEMNQLPDTQTQRLYLLGPSPERWKLRSMTYEGIANAMADQWSKN